MFFLVGFDWVCPCRAWRKNSGDSLARFPRWNKKVFHHFSGGFHILSFTHYLLWTAFPWNQILSTWQLEILLPAEFLPWHALRDLHWNMGRFEGKQKTTVDVFLQSEFCVDVGCGLVFGRSGISSQNIPCIIYQSHKGVKTDDWRNDDFQGWLWVPGYLSKGPLWCPDRCEGDHWGHWWTGRRRGVGEIWSLAVW